MQVKVILRSISTARVKGQHETSTIATKQLGLERSTTYQQARTRVLRFSFTEGWHNPPLLHTVQEDFLDV